MSGVCNFWKRRITIYNSLYKFHYKESGTNDRLVRLNDKYSRHRYTLVYERSHESCLAHNIVGSRKQIPNWLLSQDVRSTGNLELKRGVALSVFKSREREGRGGRC